MKGRDQLQPKVQEVFPRVIEVDDRPDRELLGRTRSSLTDNENNEVGPDLVAQYATEVIALLLVQSLVLSGLEVYLSHS